MSGLFPYLPSFIDLAGRKVAVLGADPAAAAKIRAFLDCGAGVIAFDPSPSPEALELEPAIRIVRRRWRKLDLQGASLVAASPLEPRAAKARAAAKAFGALFYMVDAPAISDFAFGAFAVRGALTVAVSTAGQAPALGQAVRRRIEALLPEGLDGFLTAANAARAAIEVRLSDPLARRRFWADAADAAFEETPSDWSAWLMDRVESGQEARPKASFVAVDASGGVDALTLGQARALSRAEAAFLGSGAPAAATGLLRRDCERRPLDNNPDLEAQVLSYWRRGWNIVALHGGSEKAGLFQLEKAWRQIASSGKDVADFV